MPYNFTVVSTSYDCLCYTIFISENMVYLARRPTAILTQSIKANYTVRHEAQCVPLIVERLYPAYLPYEHTIRASIITYDLIKPPFVLFSRRRGSWAERPPSNDLCQATYSGNIAHAMIHQRRLTL